MPSTGAELQVAIVGNSHIGALKKAWDACNADIAPFARLTFFGAMSASFSALEFDEEGLHAPAGSELRQRFEGTSGGLGRVDYALYDAILFVGLGVPYRIFAAQLKEHMTWDLAAKYPTPQLVSGAMLQAIADELTAQRPVARIASALAAMPPSVPMFTLAQPCPPEKIFAAGVFLERGPFDTDFADALYDKYAALNRRHALTFGATFIEQDPGTWVRPGITHDRFNQDFVTIAGTVRNREDDFSHMNTDYGAATLRHVSSTMAAAGVEPSAR